MNEYGISNDVSREPVFKTVSYITEQRSKQRTVSHSLFIKSFSTFCLSKTNLCAIHAKPLHRTKVDGVVKCVNFVQTNLAGVNRQLR